MAIAFVRNSGQLATTSPLGGGAITLPIIAGAVGNTLVVAVATAASTGATSCSDPSGITYNLDAEITSGVAITVMIFSAKITTAGVTSISINGFGASLVVEACAYEFSGVKSSTWFDTKGSGSGIGTATSAGPTAGNITEGDAWIAAFGSTASLGTFTAGGSATGLTGADQTGGSLGAEYLLTPTAGSTATGTGTFSTTGTWAGLIVAYKAAPVPAVVALSASGGSGGGALVATAPTKMGLNGGEASSGGSSSLTTPTKIALNAGASTGGGELFLDSHLDLAAGNGSSGASLAFRVPTGITESAAASSGGSLSTTAPTQIVITASSGQSEAGAPGIEPSEELEPGESLYPGQEDLPLTVPTFIQIVAGASSSTGSLGITAPAKLSLSAEGVSSGSFSGTAPTQIELNSGTASSSGSLSTIAPTRVALNISTSSSSATVGFTAPSLLNLTANGASGSSLRATTTASIALNSANATSSASIGLVVYQYIPLENAHGVSSCALVLTRFMRGEADITVSLVYHAAVSAKVLYKAVPEIILV